MRKESALIRTANDAAADILSGRNGRSPAGKHRDRSILLRRYAHVLAGYDQANDVAPGVQ